MTTYPPEVLDGRTAPNQIPPEAPSRGWTLNMGGVAGALLSLPLIALLVLFVLYPLIKVFIEASSGGEPFSRYIEVFTNSVSRRALETTLWDSFVVTVLTTLVALSIAWLIHATTRRWLRVLLWTVTLIPMWMGVVMKNYAIFIMLSKQGPVNALLLALGIVDEPVSLLYNDTTVIVGITYSLIPYAVFSLYAAISTVNLQTVTAAQALGATRSRAVLGVALPTVKGGILASMGLVFVLSIGFYITPIMLGGPQTPFMASYINQQLNSRYDFPGASASAAVLLILAAIVLGIVVAIVGLRGLRKALR